MARNTSQYDASSQLSVLRHGGEGLVLISDVHQRRHFARMTAVSNDQHASGEPRPVLATAARSAVATRWQPRPDHRYQGWRLMVKRLVDTVMAAGLLVLLLPVMVLTALAIRLSSRGPAIYRQLRVGRHGEPFTMYKFRTMCPDAEERLLSDPELHARYLEGGFKLALGEDPRVTGLGAFLRRTSLDEVPQLWNVIRGEMSLVGPRPVVPEELDQYCAYVQAYLMAIPGLTGAWQVSGRDAVKFPGRARCDAAYIDGWSLQSDIRILFRTLPAAAAARGVE